MSSQPLKLVFAGTPDFAATALKALLQAGHEIAAVYCQPDRPAGRGKKLVVGPVKQLALDNEIPVEQPINFKSPESVEKLASYQADLMIVVAYGLLLPKNVLEAPKYGCVNIHGSILPRWRGAAPIQRAIESGDQESGITIMQMDEGLDTGNMLLKSICEIESDETGSSLHDKLAALGGKAICDYLDSFDPDYSGEEQDDALANYAHKLSKQEAMIDWSQPADLIEKKIRAFNAWPVSFTYVAQKRLRVWAANLSGQSSDSAPGTVIGYDKNGIHVNCGDNQVLSLTHLQPDGAKAMSAADLLNARAAWFEEQPVLGQSD